MKKTLGWVVAVLAVVVAVALLYHWSRIKPPSEERPTPPAAEVAPPPPVTAEPQVSHPVPADQSQTPPLPTLDDSDALSKQALGGLIGAKPFAELVRVPDLIRRIVVTIDNLPRKKVSLRLLPLKSVPGRFLVSGDSESAKVDPRNSARYAAYVRLAEAVDTKKLVDSYVRLYPLFQQAYVELGYPKGYFNDRLVAVIDDLLTAPEFKDPPRLVQPHVMYEYADPALEALSAGQKIMIRMGSANAVRVKAKLRAIRAELVALVPERTRQ